MHKGSDVLKELATLGVTGGISKKPVVAQPAPKQESLPPTKAEPKVPEGFDDRLEALESALEDMLEWCSGLREQLQSAAPEDTEEPAASTKEDQEDVEESKPEISTEEASTKQEEPLAKAAGSELHNEAVQSEEGDRFGNPAWVRNL